MRSSKRQIAVTAGVIVCLVGPIIAYPRVPSHEGKTLYGWLELHQQAMAHPTEEDSQKAKVMRECETAVRAIGTAALPFLMADLRAKTNWFHRSSGWIAQHAPFLGVEPLRVERRWRRGVVGLQILGSISEPWLAELTSIATNSPQYGSQALLAVGPDSLPIVTNLLAGSQGSVAPHLIMSLVQRLDAGHISPEEALIAFPSLTNAFRSKDQTARSAAAWALGCIQMKPDVTIPLLAEGLNDPDPGVRTRCSALLERFGDEVAAHGDGIAQPLVNGLTDTIGMIQVCSALTLGRVKTNPDLAIPALERAAQDPDLAVRRAAVEALGRYGHLAESALPVIQHSETHDRSVSVRSTAAEALQRIGMDIEVNKHRHDQ